jgi:hypothetical protein
LVSSYELGSKGETLYAVMNFGMKNETRDAVMNLGREDETWCVH